MQSAKAGEKKVVGGKGRGEEGGDMFFFPRVAPFPLILYLNNFNLFLFNVCMFFKHC